MSIQELMKAMHDAGAPMEAILIAVKAIEDERQKVEAERQKEIDRKAKRAAERQSQRAARKAAKDDGDVSRDSDATVARHGSDSDATVAATTPSPSPPRDIINPPNPTPSTSLRSVEPRAKRASVAKEAAVAFERFWSAWPNKVAKRDAAKAFLKVAGEIDAILDGIARYMAAKPADREWMHPATFINGRRWEDRPAAAPQPRARAGPAFRDNRNGPGYLAAEIFGLDGNGRHQANPSETVPALPFAGDSEPRADGRDDGLVSRNPAELLIAGSVRRM